MADSILVTGAAGFIGSHVVQALLERGDRVVGLDNFDPYYSPARKHANVAEVRELTGCGVDSFLMVDGDVRDRALLDQLFEREKPRAVIHLAALAGVRASMEEPWLYHDVNLTGTINLLDATRRFGKPNFVLASTSSAYGATRDIPFRETDPADRPLANYPSSKRSAELVAHSFHRSYGLDVWALRFFTVYGPRGRPDMLPFQALAHLFTDSPLTLYRDGNVSRDWTYVGDIVQGVIQAADRRGGYEIVNIGRGEPVRVAEFMATLESATGRFAKPKSGPLPESDMEITFADITKARRLLGYEPKHSVREGVARMVDWYRAKVLAQR